jgi:hypothetical protein
LSFLPENGNATTLVLEEMGSLIFIDSNKAILAVGARASRGLGILWHTMQWIKRLRQDLQRRTEVDAYWANKMGEQPS